MDYKDTSCKDYIDARVQELFTFRPRKFGPLVCVICHDEFMAAHPLAKYCEDKCRRKAYSIRRKSQEKGRMK